MKSVCLAFPRFTARTFARSIILLASALGMALATNALASTVPQVNQPLTPSSVRPASGALTLTVNGIGFTSASTVNWNGSPRATIFVSATELTAAILATDVTTAATATVTVSTPGSGTSNAVFFQVVAPVATVALSSQQPFGLFNAQAVADFNHDGFLDIVTTDGFGNGFLSVTLGNGDGTFGRSKETVRAGTGPGLTSADFNGDGIPDVAVLDTNGSGKTVAVLLGNGDGTLRQLASYNTGLGCVWVATGDFNGDGKIDLAVVDQTDDSFSILLGNGDGTFQKHVDTSLSARPSFVIVGDFNQDGKADLAIPESGNNVAILLGNGDGTFSAPLLLNVGNDPNQVAAGDFNGDGILDLSVTLADASAIAIAAGNGDGTFGTSQNYTTTSPAAGIVLGDFDGDGILDVAVTEIPSSGPSASIGILRGNGDGTFKKALNALPSGALTEIGSYVAAGDFNRDGRLDLVAGSPLLQTPKAQNFTPASGLNFGSQVVGTTSAVRQIQISNTGEQPINLTSIVASGDFAQTNDCGSILKVFKACKINVTFTPSTTGFLRGSVIVTDDAPLSPATLNLTGLGVDLVYSTQHVGFGSVKVGSTSAPVPVTVTNASSAAMTFTSIKFQGNSGQNFAESNDCGSGLAPGASCTITTTFSPTKTGVINGTIGITYAGITQTISLNGTGT
jgi:hypothetical protein